MEPSAFLSLPLELQTEILYYLEFDEVLKVRQACRALSSATRQRSLWMSILRNPPPPMDLYSYLVDKKLEMCTSSDLEAIVTNCLRRHTCWGDPSSARVRKIDIAGWCSDCIVILPGGRWAILFSRSSGDAFAFDLHTSLGDTYQHSLLFPSSTNTWPGRLTTVVQTPEAGFQTELKIAVFSSTRPDEHRIQVWLLRPSYDAISGHVDGLKAELLSSFSGHPHPLKFYHSISGSFLGCLVRIQDSDEVYCVVIDWTKTDGEEDWEAVPKYVLSFGKRHRMGYNSFFLLPNGTLVTNMELRKSCEVWDLRSIEPVLRIEDAAEAQPIGRGDSIRVEFEQSLSLPVFCHCDGKARISISSPFHCDSRFFEGRIISIHGVEVATRLPIPPIEYGWYVSPRLQGIDKCIGFESHNHVTIAIKAARWSALPHPCSVTSFHNSVELKIKYMHIDSFSGLMIIGDPDYRQHFLMDFPLLHSCVS